MEPREYVVEQIDGDYGHLRRVDVKEEDTILVARALLPQEIYEGCHLILLRRLYGAERYYLGYDWLRRCYRG